MKSRISLTLFALLLAAVTATAQEQTGTLQGKVVDSSGGVLPGATVTVSGPTIIGGSMVAVTGEAGVYRVPNIPIGTYKVTFELVGFGTTERNGVRVQAGTTFTLDGTLAVAAVQETVTVSGASPIIETAATDVGFTFTKELMSTVPNARDAWRWLPRPPA